MNCLVFKNVKDLDVILPSDVFLSGATSLVNEEISTNMWCISASSKNIKKIDSKELVAFFDKFLEKRKIQVKNLKIAHGFIFYVWFDKMACQLRFNIISDCNLKLPFGCQLSFVNDIEEILRDFINSPYHDGILWEELEIYGSESFSEEEDDEVYTLKVFKKHLLVI